MAVIVEDGSVVSLANSYVTRSEYIAYAALIGTVIADDLTADEQLILSAKYIETFESSLIGVKVNKHQSVAYPRHEVVIDSFYWAINEIPNILKTAQILYAMMINSGEDLYNRSLNPNAYITEEKIDKAVTIKYAANSKPQDIYQKSEADMIMARLIGYENGAIILVRN